MNIKEAILNTFMVMREHKMRSVLTMLGIIVGISAVIIINSMGQGKILMMEKIFNQLGDSIVELNNNKNYKDVKYQNMVFKIRDLNAINNNPNIKVFSLRESGYITINEPADNKLPGNISVMFCAVNSSYFDILGMKVICGRIFDKNEKNNFTVIDEKLAELLFGSTDAALGKTIAFHTKWYFNMVNEIYQKYTVIGVVKNPLIQLLGSNQIQAYIPVKTFYDTTGWDYFRRIIIEGAEGVNLNYAAKSVIKQIAKKENAPEKAYSYELLNKTMNSKSKVLNKSNLIVNFVSGISLFVGGIGVMVIMLVTVTERTREIGIRKSIGATKKDIMIQFLLESVVLTLSGGVIGIIVGCVGSLIAGFFTSIPPAIDYRTIIFSVLITIAIGVIFGIYPAKKASELNPIDALRHE